MNLLVTGSSGVLGSNLVKYIDKVGKCNIYGFDLNPNFESSNFMKKFFRGDIRDSKLVRKILEETNPSVIFHTIGIYYGSCLKKADINLLGYMNLMERMKELSLESKVIVVGSSAMYGIPKKNELPVRECKNLTPVNIYGFSKKWQEEIALHYFNEFSIKTICTRPCNYIGKNVNPNLLPGLLNNKFKQKNKQKEIKIDLRSLNDVRDYIDIRDVCSALFSLVNSNVTIGDVFNISPNNGISNENLVQLYSKVSGLDYQLRSDKESSYDIYLSNQKILNKINWKPKHTLESSIQWGISGCEENE